MSYGVTDYAHRYIVRNENVSEAIAWLDENLIPNPRIEKATDDLVLVENDYGMWDGDQCGSPEGYESYAFIERFCEEGSYACFRNDDWYEFYFIWKTNTGVHVEEVDIECPFSHRMNTLEEVYAIG